MIAESSGDDANQTRHEAIEFNTIFPVEVKTRILESLPFADLMSASLVCHEWNDIINASRNLDQVVYQFSAYTIQSSQNSCKRAVQS